MSSSPRQPADNYVYAWQLGLTVAEVRERWPHAVEYGPASDPYWDRNDLDGIDNVRATD
jgi:hypothetical protein